MLSENGWELWIVTTPCSGAENVESLTVIEVASQQRRVAQQGDLSRRLPDEERDDHDERDQDSFE
jgi:hypothetical protein